MFGLVHLSFNFGRIQFTTQDHFKARIRRRQPVGNSGFLVVDFAKSKCSAGSALAAVGTEEAIGLQKERLNIGKHLTYSHASSAVGQPESG